MCFSTLCPQIVPKGIGAFVASNLRLRRAYIKAFLFKGDDKRNARKVSIMFY